MNQRYFLEIAYNGRDYFGWQKQPNEITVQETIENALQKLNSDEVVQTMGCGRTDTGVHAKEFVLHFDMKQIEDESKFIFKLNRMLPDSIAIHSIQKVPDNAHARFDAKQRTYRYFIHQTKNPFQSEQSWYFKQSLDFDAMNLAASKMVGTHDFTSLSKLHTDVKTNICTVSSAKWFQSSDDSAFFEIKADRFLRNMVRATVGTLIKVGEGKLSPEGFSTILEKKDRHEASTSVPAHGLFLWKILY